MERKVAKTVGGQRIPCSGSFIFRDVSGDVLHDRFEIECKYRSKFVLKKWFDKLKIQARKNKKIPLLVVKMKGQHGEYIIMDLESFFSFISEKNKTASSKVG